MFTLTVESWAPPVLSHTMQCQLLESMHETSKPNMVWHPNGSQLQGNSQCLPRPAVCLPQPLPPPLLFHQDSSSFQGLVIPHTRRRGKAEADAPINVYHSPLKCSDAPNGNSRCGRRHHTSV